MIEEINLNLYGGTFQYIMKFTAGLNIIAGENGTGKTKLLQQLKTLSGCLVSDNQTNTNTIIAISPKRNSQRKEIETVFQEYRQQNKNYDSITTDRIQSQLIDNNFVNYAPLTEVFYAHYEREIKDGSSQIDKMKKTVDSFNQIISSIFDNYKLDAQWDSTRGIPKLLIIKNNLNKIPLSGLSTGEQEIFSLIVNIFNMTEKAKVFVIDEPEIHLNWHLEEKLFEFLSKISTEKAIQFIVATHSRTIFKPKFISKVQFLKWENNKVTVTNTLTLEERTRIAGEAIEIIKLGQFNKKTIFTEDQSHEDILQGLSTILRTSINIVQAGNSSNVKSLFKLSKQEGGWLNSFFLVDGDNQGNQFSTESSFIHLEKYCIENYLLHISTLSGLFSKSEDEIKQELVDIIKFKKGKILKNNKFFEFLIDRLTFQDITQDSLDTLDGSEILIDFLNKFHKNRRQFSEEFSNYLQGRNELELVFGRRLLDLVS